MLLRMHWPDKPWIGVLRLVVAAFLVGFVWLTILPYIARMPTVRSFIERNEALGIDPSAKFYTELPAMPRLLERIRAARRATGETKELPACCRSE
jgi:hypothetical protein